MQTSTGIFTTAVAILLVVCQVQAMPFHERFAQRSKLTAHASSSPTNGSTYEKIMKELNMDAQVR